MENRKTLCFVLCFTLVRASLTNDDPTNHIDNDIEIGSPAMPSQWCIEWNLTAFAKDEMELSGLQSCCDQHYNCWKTDFIAQGEQKHGITNTMAQTATPCECNSRFVKCFKAMKTYSAQVLYTMYILTVEKCFLYSWPIQGCLNRDRFNRCTRYDMKDGVAKHHLFDQHYIEGDDDDGIITSDDLPNFDINTRSMEQNLQNFHQFNQQMIPYPVTFWPHNRPNFFYYK